MKIFFALLLITFLAISGYHLTFRGFRLPLFARKFYFTGTEFLFLGLLLGPQFLNILDEQTCAGLEPLSALLLGWIGLLFGFQFEIPKLKRFPSEFFMASIVEGLITFFLVFSGIYYVFQFSSLPLISTMSGPMKYSAALTLAAAAACTAQTGLALFAPGAIARKSSTIRLLQYISGIDGLSAMLIFSLVFLFRPSILDGNSWVNVLGRGTLVTGIAIAGLLVLYLLFLTQRREESELSLVVIGMAVVTSGTALILNFSPLLINFFVGFCLVNLTREKERIFNILNSVEKPVYLLLLVLLGAGWEINSLWLLVFSIGYCLLRATGKFLGGFFITYLGPNLRTHPHGLGLGLLEQGGLALAILFDFHRGFSCEMADMVVSIALLAIIYNDLLSSFSLKRLLKENR